MPCESHQLKFIPWFTQFWHRLSVSQKGYMTGEIGREWIKHDFDPPREVAQGHTWLLIVDGHSSHFTQEFLEYAKDHDIHVLCLPPHITHTLQSEFYANPSSVQPTNLQ